MTGIGLRSAMSPKVVSSASAIHGSGALQRPQRGVPEATAGTLLRVAHAGQAAMGRR